MSRAFNLAMTADEIVKHCADKSIDISVIEPLPEGGTRLVCSSGHGAAQIRTKLKGKIIEGEVRRDLFSRRRPQW